MALKNGFACGDLFVVINSETQPPELDALSRTAPSYVVVRIATHPNTPVSTLTRLALSANADIRCAISENPKTPLNVLWALTHDRDADVRYSLAENHNINASILTTLSSDENPYVAARAQRTLQRRSSTGITVIPQSVAGYAYA